VRAIALWSLGPGRRNRHYQKYDIRLTARDGEQHATPGEVKAGLERIKWMPCANGGPGCCGDSS